MAKLSNLPYFYVDNFMKSVKTEKEDNHMVGDMTSLMLEGGFRLMEMSIRYNSVKRQIERSKSLVELVLDIEDLSTKRSLVLIFATKGKFAFKRTKTET